MKRLVSALAVSAVVVGSVVVAVSPGSSTAKPSKHYCYRAKPPGKCVVRTKKRDFVLESGGTYADAKRVVAIEGECEAFECPISL